MGWTSGFQSTSTLMAIVQFSSVSDTCKDFLVQIVIEYLFRPVYSRIPFQAAVLQLSHLACSQLRHLTSVCMFLGPSRPFSY